MSGIEVSCYLLTSSGSGSGIGMSCMSRIHEQDRVPFMIGIGVFCMIGIGMFCMSMLYDRDWHVLYERDRDFMIGIGVSQMIKMYKSSSHMMFVYLHLVRAHFSRYIKAGQLHLIPHIIHCYTF
jgi:hypothetical protein